MKKVCVIGLGYVGLPTACILSSKGFKVVGVDANQKLVEELNQVNIDPLEPGLVGLANSAIKSDNLIPKICPKEADVFMICVPTPLTDENEADLSCIKNAAESVLPYLRKHNLVVLESTVPPGTTKGILKPILEKSGLKDLAKAWQDYYRFKNSIISDLLIRVDKLVSLKNEMEGQKNLLSLLQHNLEALEKQVQAGVASPSDLWAMSGWIIAAKTKTQNLSSKLDTLKRKVAVSVAGKRWPELPGMLPKIINQEYKRIPKQAGSGS